MSVSLCTPYEQQVRKTYKRKLHTFGVRDGIMLFVFCQLIAQVNKLRPEKLLTMKM